MQANLAEIRQGKAEQLKGDYPAEIQPVADELNLLIQSNVEIVERARTQVGNLAHALKTPLSVLTNEAAAQEGPLAAKVREQAELMRDQVSLYLDRARRAARAQGIGAVTEVKPVLEALARTLERINRDKGVAIRRRLPGGPEVPGRAAGPRGDGGQPPRQCLQMGGGAGVAVGGACARARHGRPDIPGDRGRGRRARPSADKRAEALKRGQRLDETKPGSGLGLSIVAETAAMYNGTVHLDDAAAGRAAGGADAALSRLTAVAVRQIHL